MTPSTALVPGYDLGDLLGAGSSATVFRARNQATHDAVAVKVLADNHSLRADMRRRFLDEVDLLAAIESPAVARVHDSGQTADGRLFMVLDLADRGDLRQRKATAQAAGTEIGPTDALALVDHLRHALGALHRAKIVHRDLAPGNVLIRSGATAPDRPATVLLAPDEHLVLTDLGLAKDLEFASGVTAGTGTRGFAAPEQLQPVSIVDVRSDVYGASALLAWMVEGMAIAPALTEVLATGRAPEPDDRHATIDAWADAVTEAIEQYERASKAAPTWTPPVVDAAPAAPGWRPGVGALIGAAAVAVIAFGAAALASNGSGDSADAAGAADTANAAEALADTAEADAAAAASEPSGATTAAADAASTPTPTAASANAPSTTDAEGAGAAADTDDDASPTNPGDTTTSMSSSITTPGASSSSAPSSASTTVSTTALSTTVTSTATTVDPFADSPRAAIVSPADGAQVAGALVVTGTARYPGGVDRVDLTVKDLDRLLHWDGTSAFATPWVRFPVAVDSPGAADTSWRVTIPESELPAGTYRVRAWARGIDGRGDPVSVTHTVTVT
ncbi:MAG: protein kinase [Actinomycetota bacterium]